MLLRKAHVQLIYIFKLEWYLRPSPTCPGCSRARRFFPHKSTRAILLDVDGLRHVRHVPRRCQARGCPLKGEIALGKR